MPPEQTFEQRKRALTDAGLTTTQQSNVVSGVSTTPSPISVSTITTPQTPLNVQASTTTPPPDISTIPTELPKPTIPTTPTAPVSDFTTRLQGLEATLSGKTADTATQINQVVSPYETSLNEVNTQIKQLQAESLARQEAILKRPGGTLESVSTEAQIQNRTDAIEALKLSAIQLGLQGNMALAEKQAQRMIDAKYGQTEKDLQVARQNIENNWDTLTPAEKKIALATLQRLDKEDAFVKTQREVDKTTQGYVASATANVANFTPTAQYKTVTQALQAMSNATTPEQALQISASTGLTSTESKLDVEYKKAQIASLYANAQKALRESNAVDTMNPTDLIAYANQYASTGQIPTGLPKGTFGVVAQYAKQTPKNDGSIVSTITGIKDNKVPAAEQDDLGRLYNITKMADRLIELDKQRIGGVVAGTLGKVFGSEAQGEYLTIRKAIVDEIARMQTGAALTLQEQDFYEDYLPGRFSETFGLGQSSEKKINNFKSVMEQKLKGSLSNRNLSIYGYSPVKLGGKEYKVGDEIEVNGIRGRVLPDGSVAEI